MSLAPTLYQSQLIVVNTNFACCQRSRPGDTGCHGEAAQTAATCQCALLPLTRLWRAVAANLLHVTVAASLIQTSQFLNDLHFHGDRAQTLVWRQCSVGAYALHRPEQPPKLLVKVDQV